MKKVTVFITGQTGVGKLATAKVLQPKLEAVLNDNQKLAVILFETFGVVRGGDVDEKTLNNIFSLYHDMVYPLIRATARAKKKLNYIFTNPLIDGDPRAHSMLMEFEVATKARDAHFLPIVLECSNEEEHMDRVVSEGRAEQFKLDNPAVLKRMLTTHSHYVPDHSNTIVIDTAGMYPGCVAELIMDYLEKQLDPDYSHDETLYRNAMLN